ncbi:class I SAM-dependent methyltransferase [bacterium]|nr:class I SAM-dependent methyltransferase [bacterium]
MAVLHFDLCPVCGNDFLKHHLTVKDHAHSSEVFDLIQCRNCELVLTQDMPDRKSIGPYYKVESYIPHSDTQKGVVNSCYHLARHWTLRKKRILINGFFNSSAQGNLLDIGAGTGYFLNHMQLNGWKVNGIEQDIEAVKFCKDAFELDVDSPDELLKYSDDFYDVITMWHVLEHVHDLDKYLQNIYRILKPGGRLFVALPNYDSIDANIYKDFWAAYDVPRHIWHFNPTAIKYLLDKCRFKLIESHAMPLDAFYISMLSEKYKHSSLTFIRGILVGLMSVVKSLRNNVTASSLTYIFEKSIGT